MNIVILPMFIVAGAMCLITFVVGMRQCIFDSRKGNRKTWYTEVTTLVPLAIFFLASGGMINTLMMMNLWPDTIFSYIFLFSLIAIGWFFLIYTIILVYRKRKNKASQRPIS